MKLKTLWPEDCPAVRKALGMTPDSIKNDVTLLKDWLRKQPHLGPLTGVNEDTWLENYLVMNKNSVERAKASLDVYFKMRWVLPDMFQSRDFSTESMDHSFNNTCLCMMPGLTTEGYRVVVYSHFTEDAAHFNPPELARRVLAMGDVGLAHAIDRVSTVLILDLANTRVNHLGKYNLSFVKNMFDYSWKAYPERVAAIHIINPPPIMEMALNFFKPFLKQKLVNRIQIHSSVDSLKDHISMASIPKDYGGDGPSCKDMNRAWQTLLVEERALLDTVATHRSQEHLRPEARKDTRSWADIGVDGTFRKLTLD